MQHVRTTYEPHYRLTYEDPQDLPIFNDERICEALQRVITQGYSVLITPLPEGFYEVDISYSSLERNLAARDAFDTAEYGVDKSPERALRRALGAHYGGATLADELHEGAVTLDVPNPDDHDWATCTYKQHQSAHEANLFHGKDCPACGQVAE